VQCNRLFLSQIARALAENDCWKPLVQAAFMHAFDWLGFGAKTAVGYGAMEQLSEEEIAKTQRESVAASIKCDWVDKTIDELAQKNRAEPEETLRGKALAEAWATLTDTDLQRRALDDIRSRWQEKNGGTLRLQGLRRRRKESTKAKDSVLGYQEAA